MELVFRNERSKLYLGDAANMTAIDDNSIDFICTSPPYFNGKEEYSSYTTYFDYMTEMDFVVQEMWRVLKSGGRIAVNVPLGYDRDPYIPIGCDWTQLLKNHLFRLRGHIIWVKGETNGSTAWGSWLSPSNPTLRDTHEIIIVANKGDNKIDSAGKESTINSETFLLATSSVWNIQPRSSSWHPAVFPAEIPRRLIELYTFAGDTVLDPFAGSCTTVWTAESLGRNAIGIERKEDYLKQAVGTLFYRRMV